jgi:hypothetical protein
MEIRRLQRTAGNAAVASLLGHPSPDRAEAMVQREPQVVPETTIAVSDAANAAWKRGEFDGYLGMKNDPIGTAGVGMKYAEDYQAGYEEGQDEQKRGEKSANLERLPPQADDAIESLAAKHGSIGPAQPRVRSEGESERPEGFDEEAPYGDEEAMKKLLDEMEESGTLMMGEAAD